MSPAMLSLIGQAILSEGLESLGLKKMCRGEGLAVEYFAHGRQSILFTIRAKCSSAKLILKLPRSLQDTGALHREKHFLERTTTSSFPRVVSWSRDPPCLCLEYVSGREAAALSSTAARS